MTTARACVRAPLLQVRTPVSLACPHLRPRAQRAKATGQGRTAAKVIWLELESPPSFHTHALALPLRALKTPGGRVRAGRTLRRQLTVPGTCKRFLPSCQRSSLNSGPLHVWGGLCSHVQGHGQRCYHSLVMSTVGAHGRRVHAGPAYRLTLRFIDGETETQEKTEIALVSDPGPD